MKTDTKTTEDFSLTQERINNLEKEFNDKKSGIESREKIFKELDSLIEKTYSDDTEKVIKLNIGGKTFTTLLSTLVKIKDTLFYKLVCNHIKNDIQIPEEIFIDRSFTYFEIILNYLKFNTLQLKNFSTYEKSDILAEIEYYGLQDHLGLTKLKNDIDVEWDAALSKAGTFTISSDRKHISINSTTCYSHWVVQRSFKDEDFLVSLEVDVRQNDTYLYVGLANQNYKFPSNCGCCNPKNAWYIQCNGTMHNDGSNQSYGQLNWKSEKIIINMSVYLTNPTDMKVVFSFPEKPDIQLGPYKLHGTEFKVYVGHCNKGDGNISILECSTLQH